MRSDLELVLSQTQICHQVKLDESNLADSFRPSQWLNLRLHPRTLFLQLMRVFQPRHPFFKRRSEFFQFGELNIVVYWFVHFRQQRRRGRTSARCVVLDGNFVTVCVRRTNSRACLAGLQQHRDESLFEKPSSELIRFPAIRAYACNSDGLSQLWRLYSNKDVNLSSAGHGICVCVHRGGSHSVSVVNISDLADLNHDMSVDYEWECVCFAFWRRPPPCIHLGFYLRSCINELHDTGFAKARRIW